jgi:hypothetical protein
MISRPFERRLFAMRHKRRMGRYVAHSPEQAVLGEGGVVDGIIAVSLQAKVSTSSL